MCCKRTWSVLKDNSQILQTVEGCQEAWTLSMWHCSWNEVGNWWWQCWQVVWISQLSPFCLSSSRWFLTWCWEPAREIPAMTRSCKTRGTPWAIPSMTRSCGRVLISKASGLDGPPGPAWASTPKPDSVCLTILRLSPTLLALTGGCPRPPFPGKS